MPLVNSNYAKRLSEIKSLENPPRQHRGLTDQPCDLEVCGGVTSSTVFSRFSTGLPKAFSTSAWGCIGGAKEHPMGAAGDRQRLRAGAWGLGSKQGKREG